MDFFIPTAYAQAAGAPGQGQLMSMLPFILVIVVFYFLLIRPQSKKAKEHRDMVQKLQTGDEVVAAGGILGRITEAGDPYITLEVAKGVELKVQRFQVTQLLPKGTVKGA